MFGFGAASTALVALHFGANTSERGRRAGWTMAFYRGALSGPVWRGAPFLRLSTDSEVVRAAANIYQQSERISANH